MIKVVKFKKSLKMHTKNCINIKKKLKIFKLKLCKIEK